MTPKVDSLREHRRLAVDPALVKPGFDLGTVPASDKIAARVIYIIRSTLKTSFGNGS